MRNSRLARMAAEETYMDVRPIIIQNVTALRKRYGWDWDDLLSIAHEAFMDAFQSYKRERGSFTDRLRFLIWTKVQSEEKKQWLRRRRFHIQKWNESLSECCDPQQESSIYWLTDFMDQLGEDAKIVVMMTLEAPINVRLAITQHGGGSMGIRAAIREVLIDLDWASSRVTQAFTEIGRALNG